MICFRTDILGFLAAIMIVVASTISGAAMQAINGVIPNLELTMFRYFGLLMIALVCLKTTNTPLNVPIGSYFNIVVTSLASGGFCLFYYAAMNYLPLTHVSATVMSLRTIIMAVLVKLLKGEVRKFVLIASVGCLAGILLVVQPWDEFQNILSAQYNLTDTNNVTDLDYISIKNQKIHMNALFGYFMAFIAALCDACFMTTVGVYLKTMHSMVISLLSSCICIMITGLLTFYISQPVIIVDQSTILLLCLHVIFSSLTVVMQIVSCQLMEPVHVSLIENLEIVTFLIPQYLIMKNEFHGHMNLMEISGCCLIVVILAGTAPLSFKGNHEDFTQ